MPLSTEAKQLIAAFKEGFNTAWTAVKIAMLVFTGCAIAAIAVATALHILAAVWRL